MNNILKKFLQGEASGGILMIFAALLAFILANSAFSPAYFSFISTNISFGNLSHPLNEWVKDVLMVFFFLLIGLELKREMLEGVLADKKQILLPLIAAMGGMLVPAGIFLTINHQLPENLNGWAIPCATDIAFALCILQLVGKKVPPALKIFLLAIAIFDDLGAIIIIALFYSQSLNIFPLMLGVAGIITLILLNKFHIQKISAYIAVGILLWFCLYNGGIHTTIAGVLVGMAIPMRNPKDPSSSPLNTCMHFLHPWVIFFILPFFAFNESGINLQNVQLSQITTPLTMGISFALFLGKPIGIFTSSYLLIKAKLAHLPAQCNWQHIYGVSVLAGIGFTMSLFIGTLAFTNAELQTQVKIGVICGSILSGLFGLLILKSIKK